jgi:hypothetical protein
MNLYTLSRKRQQALAIGLTMGVMALGSMLAITPVSEAIAARQDNIRKAEAELIKLQGIVASRDVMMAAMQDQAGTDRADGLTLPVSTDAQAIGSVQATVRRALSDAEADLKSIQPLDVRGNKSLKEAGVRVVALTTHQQLEDTLFTIANASPRLFIRDANIQLASGSRRLADGSEPPLLQVRLDVFTYALREE